MNGSPNLQGTNAGALLPTDMAGAPGYAQVNWNVLGRYGNNETNSSGTNAFAILDSAGDDTHITINWDASGNYSQSGGGTPNAQGSPDGNLMNAYCDSGGNANVALTNGLSNRLFSQNNNDKPLVYIGGLQAWLATEGATSYDVVLYGDGDSTQGRTWEYWLQNAYDGDTTGPLTNLVFGSDLTTHAFMCDRANFVTTGLYVQVPLASPACMDATYAGLGGGNAGWGATIGNNPGNYVVFQGLSADSLLLRTEEFRAAGSTLRSPINVIQIVPRTTPAPPTVGPLADANVYTGGTAKFQAWVGGVLPLTYQWQKNGAPLSDGGNIAGSSSSALTITGVSASDAANYTLVVSNINGISTVSAPLVVSSYGANTFAEETVTNHPYAYWRLNDADIPSTNNAFARDSFGGFTGVYGLAAQNASGGVAGPQQPAFPGFEADNAALQTANGTLNSWVIAPPLHLNTNTVTMCAWIYPTAATEPANCGILFSRTTIAGAQTTGATDQSGLNYFGTAVPNSLGYTWNGASSTYNFQSKLVIPSNQWSFVGAIISPTNAILFVYNTNSLLSATNAIAHGVVAFNGFTSIGNDPSGAIGGTPAGRVFSGMIDEVAVYNRSLPLIEIYNLYRRGLHLTAVPPVVTAQPQPSAIYAGRTARFTVAASGNPFLALNYQWRKNTGSGPVNLSNTGNISGANSATLVVSNATAADVASYDVFVQNLDGSTTSLPATLTVVTPPATFTAYEAALQTANPAHYWRMNEDSSAVYVNDFWGGIVATNDVATPGQPGPQAPDFAGFESTNSSYAFDGFGSFVDAQNSIMNNLAAFSIVGWFNTGGVEPVRTGLFGQNDVTEFGFQGADASGQAQLGIWTPSGAAYLPQSLVTPNQWYMAAGVGSGTSVSLYLFTTNGGGGYIASQATTLNTTTNYGNSIYNFHIGGGGILDPTGNPFFGNIDEVATFNRALSASELATLFGTAIGATSLAPQVTIQPGPATNVLYAGRTVTLSVAAFGSGSLSYQWRANGAPVAATNATGATATTLVITNITAANAADYDVVVANASGSATSVVAHIDVITPKAGGYEAALIGLHPLAYYRLNETNGTTAYDYWGGFAGTYGASAVIGVPGVENPPFLGFETNNTAIWTSSGAPASGVTNNFGQLNTNTATFTMWLYPTNTQDSYAGLEINRGGNNPGGFGYTAGHLGYTWNNNNGATYGATWSANLVPPTNEWSLVALVVTPTNATVYMLDPDSYQGALNTNNVATANVANNVEAKTGTWQIGNDTGGATRTFSGLIDEVAIFDRSLSPTEIQQLYTVGSSGGRVTLTVKNLGASLLLTWPQGILQSAPTIGGPWTDQPGTSPLTIAAPASQAYWRVRVPPFGE